MSRQLASQLYEQFQQARREAVELTDVYHDVGDDEVRRSAVWTRVVEQTETARELLEAWLHADEPADTAVVPKH